MPIKSFRGKLKDGDIDTIALHTNDGSMGYRITKFQLMPNREVDDLGAIVKIFSIPQTTATEDIDFDDNTMLAAGLYRQDSGNQFNFGQNIVFDNMTFNQDIFITYKDDETADKFINYYIELEQIKLDLNENTVATLKDIKNIEASYL
tara:strand:+ start:21 stop:464 length:444 start_codon:yes stop_codon:yes gene_type:complete